MNFSKYSSSRLRMIVAVPLSTCKNTNYVSNCNLLREKCPNTDIFLVIVFLYLDCIFSPNKRKYGPEKNRYLDTLHAVTLSKLYFHFRKGCP